MVFQFQTEKVNFEQRFAGREGTNHLISEGSNILGRGTTGTKSPGQEHKSYTKWKIRKHSVGRENGRRWRS